MKYYLTPIKNTLKSQNLGGEQTFSPMHTFEAFVEVSKTINNIPQPPECERCLIYVFGFSFTNLEQLRIKIDNGQRMAAELVHDGNNSFRLEKIIEIQ